MPLDGDVKQVIDQLGATFEEFKKAHQQEIQEIKAKGAVDAVTRDKLDKLDKSLNELSEAKKKADDATLKRMDELEKKLNRPKLGGDPDAEVKALREFNAHVQAWDSIKANAPPGGVTADGFAEYKAAMPSYLRRGASALSDAERKTMSVGGDPDGGYLVTPDMSGAIVTRVFESSPIRQIASVQGIGTDALEGVRDTDEAGAGWVGEQGARPATTTPQVFKYRIPVHEMYAMPEATQQLLDDASINVETWLAGKIGERFGRLEATAFVTGDGVGKPRGFASYATAATADASRAWGTLEHVVSGANGDFAGTTPADKLFDLIGQFKDEYLQSASWVTRREVITKIRKFKDAQNQYLWQPGLQQGQPERLIAFPVVIAQDMPALATNSLSLALGDFRRAYQIVDRQGVRTLRDPYTNKPYVRFYTTRRVGGDVVQFEAIKFLRFST